MKLRNIALALSLFALSLTAGCQVPQPSPQPTVSLTCTPSKDATSSYLYVFARASCTSATSCPANTAGNTAYSAINPSGSATCSITDTAPLSGFVTYTVSEVNAGVTGQPSGQVNSGVPLSVPSYPGTPGSLNGTQTAALAPPLKPDGKTLPQIASNKIGTATGLKAKVNPGF
jgi:hypothetical protein